MALEIMEFMRRYLQHVLPTGFMKVRHYGFMNSASSVELEKVKSLIELATALRERCQRLLSTTTCTHGVPLVGATWRFADGYIRSSPGLLSMDDAELLG